MVFKLILRFGRKSGQVLLFDCLALIELSVFSPITCAVLLLKPVFKRSGSNGGCGFGVAPAFTEFQVKGDPQRESVLVFLFLSQPTPLFLLHLFYLELEKLKRFSLFFEVCCISLCECKDYPALVYLKKSLTMLTVCHLQPLQHDWGNAQHLRKSAFLSDV